VYEYQFLIQVKIHVKESLINIFLVNETM